MKKIAIVILTLILALNFMATVGFAKTKVKGYTTKKGTYVAPHYRSDKNNNFKDNWSTKGNKNPITGKKGTKTHK